MGKVVFYLLVVLSLSVACDKEEEVVKKSKEAKILKWQFGDKVAVISGTDIKITFPFGTNIATLTAKATLSPKATISPDPTKSRDYKTPVVFTVTAGDGTTTKKYTVTVTVAKNDEAKILKWQFGDKAATISGTDIKITFPFGTDVTALTAKATPSPMATISPDPTKSEDYTNPKKFTVTAEDGTTKKQYTVTVTVAKNDEAKILKWQFGDKAAAIIGTDIKIKFPFGTNITALTAKAVLSPKATINPDPTKSEDYTNPKKFTVTAEDGTTKKQYTVTVTVAKSSWEQKYGRNTDDVAYSLIQTADGGYAMAGEAIATIGNGVDFWLVKVDANGDEEWQKNYGGSGTDKPSSLIQTTDGGYAIAGNKNDADVWLVKVASNGDKQWDKTYDGGGDFDAAKSLIQTTDGGYAMAGETYSKGAGDADVWLIKVANNGDKQWDKTYGGSDYDVAKSLIQTTDGGYAMAGSTESKGAGDVDFWLVKVANNGDKQWDKTYGGSQADEAKSLIQTTDGGYAMAGDTFNTVSSDYDFWLVKVDSKGDKQWDKTYDGGGDNDEAYSLIQTKDGGYAMAGRTYSKGVGDADVWLVKVDGKGDKQWEKNYGGSEEDEAYSLIQTKDGSYVLAGSTVVKDSSGFANYDFWLVKVDSKGKL